MPWLSCVVSNIVLALLLALAAWFVQRCLRWYAIAHILWLLALVKLVTPPLVSVPLREAPLLTACELGICNCGQHARNQAGMLDTLPWVLLAAWLAGAGTMGWLAWCRWAQFRRLITHAIPAPPEWQSLAARLSSELSIRCPPEILVVPGRLPPLVVPGRHRPCMLLPMGLLDQLNPSQRVALLLHELIHIKRGDHLARILELTVGVIYWWLPITGSIGRQLRTCEEACCDTAVVAHLPDARNDYARLLLDVVDFADPILGQALPQATAMSAANSLEKRLLTILDATKGTRRTRPAGAFTVALACAILPCGLHYDFVGSPAPVPAATSTEQEPDTPSPSGDGENRLFKADCCPS